MFGKKQAESDTSGGGMGKVYGDGEVIIRQGEPVNGMYVIQAGFVDIIREDQGKEIPLTQLKEKDFFGEVPLFERLNQGGIGRATARAVNEARVLTVDKKTILRRIHEDPSLAYRILETMSRRIRQLEEDMVKLLTEK